MRSLGAGSLALIEPSQLWVSGPFYSCLASCGRLSGVTNVVPAAADPLRVSDLVPLRRMLGTDSVVIRINPDGSFVPFQRMPALFFERPIRQVLTEDVDDRFAEACQSAIDQRAPVAFRPDETRTDEVMINPILDNDGTKCRFLVCWVRSTDVMRAGSANLGWDDLRLDQVTVRYRRRSIEGNVVVEAAPWWAPSGEGDQLELWPHHSHVSAMGLGHAVMETLITHAAEAAAEFSGGPAVRIEVPSADMLAGLVPVFHGAVRASGLEPSRVIVAIDVALAVDQDLLPIIVHLRTMGLQIDIVGLDALSATLHTVSDTSRHSIAIEAPALDQLSDWTNTFYTAMAQAA